MPEGLAPTLAAGGVERKKDVLAELVDESLWRMGECLGASPYQGLEGNLSAPWAQPENPS